MLISDGWAAPFQKLGSDTPAVARLFSQNLFDRFSGKDAGTLFPVEKRLKKEIRDIVQAKLLEFGNTEELKDILDSRFRVMEQYLRTDVIPSTVKRTLAKDS